MVAATLEKIQDGIAAKAKSHYRNNSNCGSAERCCDTGRGAILCRNETAL